MNSDPKEVMRKAFSDALEIVEKRGKDLKMFIQTGDSILIAASNLAMALFSFEMGHMISDQDIDDLKDFFKDQDKDKS